MKKLLLGLGVFVAVLAFADDQPIYLPNIPGYATGTQVGTKLGVDMNIVNTSVPVSGTVAATQSGAWTVSSKTQDGSGNSIGSTSGALNVNISSGSVTASNPSVGTNNTTAPTSSTEIGIIDGTGKLQGVSATNPLPISGSFSSANGVVSSVNSTTSTLGSSASFTGTSEDVSNYSAVTVSVATDQNGTLNFQYSANGTNWDQVESQPITVASAGSVSGFFYSLATEAKYFRVVYTNGGTSQGVMRLQTVYKITPPTGDVTSIALAPVTSQNALVTKSVIYGLNSSGFGNYVAAKVTSSGSLTTAIGDISGVVGQNTMANSLPVAIASNQSAIPASQSGTWTTGRTWSLLNTTDSVNAVQSGTWTTGRTWTLSSGTDSVAATQSGTWTVQPGNVANTTAWLVTGTGGTFPATQSGTWTVQPGNTANTTPWLTKLNDGTNSFTVKAASTAAVASDTAVVVAVSPNNSVATKSPVNANGSLSANNSVTGTESNIAAPSNAVGVIVQARDANTANVSYGFNNATTAILASGGLQLQPGRDSGFIPVGTGAYLHLISASGTQTVDVQWILSQ